ncbi:MAG: molecular chaperone [Desulfopila sp.]
MVATLSRHLGVLFRFCAQSMRYPQPDWYTTSYQKSLLELLNTLEGEDEHRALADFFANSTDSLEELQIEHTRLFINGIPHVLAPPYGSVYIDRSLQGQQSEKTLRFYRQQGYLLKAQSDLCDHIVPQLEFLALLAEKHDLATANTFLRTIFLPWFSKFAARVRQEANGPFYPIIVQLIDYLTMEDDEYGIQSDEA